MENKYFTPEISDFHIGYEYETIYLKSVWTKESLRIIDAGWFFESYENDAVPTEFRVPYLTKEQIEAEGWTYEGNTRYTWPSFIKGDYILLFKFKDDHTIHIHDLNKYNTKYSGECKSINELRYICKLLKIN